MMETMLSCLGYHSVGLVAKLCSQLPMALQNLLRRMQFLVVPRSMRCDLSCACAIPPYLLQMFFDLLAARTRRVKILLGIAFDLWLSVLAGLDLVSQPLKPDGKLRTIHTRHIMLGLEEASLLECAGLAVLALGDIEDDSMSV